MSENIIKVIDNIYLWPKGMSVLHYYNLIFTETKIIWEFIDKNVYIPTFGGGHAIFILPFVLLSHIRKKRTVKKKGVIEKYEKKNVEEILNKQLESFAIDYYSIEKVKIKKGSTKIEFTRDHPITGKKRSIHFDKENQYDVENIFTKMLPKKTIIKS